MASSLYSESQLNASEISSCDDKLYQNPDGTFIHFQKQILETKDKVTNQFKNLDAYIFPSAYDDEFGFIIPRRDQIPQFVNDCCYLYQKHSKIFGWFLILQLVIELIFNWLIFLNRQRKIDELSDIYADLQQHHLQYLFWTFLSIDMMVAILYYPLGFLSIYKRSVRHYYLFTILALVDIILEMFLAYINKFNFLLFLLRIFSYIYSKYLAHLLINILLIPRH